MKISIIIPAFNEEQLLPATLHHVQAALRAFERRQWSVELIVCDNNSTDRTAELARGAGANVVFEPVNQIARARNRGAAAATGDWFIFVDADTCPTVELFEDVAGQIESGRCLAGGSTMRFEGHYPVARMLTRLFNRIMRRVHWLAGSFIFCDATVFRKIGGFSNELFASEEIDLSKRLKQFARADGRKIVILHRHPILTSARKMHLYTAREHLWFMAKTIFSRGGTLRDRTACHTWYDGRR